MATVKEAVKESLVGTTREPQLSQQARATFDRNARQDDSSEEPYMTEEDFVNAIAPPNEDYVSSRLLRPSGASKVFSMTLMDNSAQNQAGTVCNPLWHCRPTKDWARYSPRLGPFRKPALKARRRV